MKTIRRCFMTVVIAGVAAVVAELVTNMMIDIKGTGKTL